MEHMLGKYPSAILLPSMSFKVSMFGRALSTYTGVCGRMAQCGVAAWSRDRQLPISSQCLPEGKSNAHATVISIVHPHGLGAFYQTQYSATCSSSLAILSLRSPGPNLKGPPYELFLVLGLECPTLCAKAAELLRLTWLVRGTTPIVTRRQVYFGANRARSGMMLLKPNFKKKGIVLNFC